MRKSRTLAYVFISLFILPITQLVAQQVQISVMIQPLPSPYFVDWESDGTIAEIQFSGDFVQPTNIIIQGVVTEDRFGEMMFAQSEIIQVDQGQWDLVLNNPNMFDWPTVNFHPMFDGDEQGGAGLIPDGNYTLCVTVINADDENPMGTNCGYFNILLPEPPQITSPIDGQACDPENFIIQWLPVQWLADHPVTYNVIIAEMYPNQQAQEAIESNPPHFEAQVEDATVLIYPYEALPLESGHKYAIAIQSVNEENQPIGSNFGFSQVEFCAVRGPVINTFIYPWQEDVAKYTNEEFLKNISLEGDPCDSVKALIDNLLLRLMYVLAMEGEEKDKSAKAKKEITDADDAIKKADDDIKDAQEALDKAIADRKIILDAMVKSAGGSYGTWNNGEPDCKADVVIGPKNGDLQLGSNTAICLSADQVTDFLEKFNEWRSELVALNKSVKKAQKAKAKAEKAKADAQAKKSQAEKDKKAADKEAAEWTKEADALLIALDDLDELAAKCLLIIEDLRKKYDAARKELSSAERWLAGAKPSQSGGGNSKEKYDDAEDKINEAKDALEKGNYEGATTAAQESKKLSAEGSKWSEVEDCIEEAKKRIARAKKKLAEQKAEFPSGDFSKAQTALDRAEKDLAAAEAAYKNKDREAALEFCRSARYYASDARTYAAQVGCNEGQTKEKKNVLQERHYVGKLIMPWGVEPANLGYKLKEFLADWGDPGGISGYVDMLYGLSSVSKVKSAYSIYWEERCTEVFICKNGKWVHDEYKDCNETLVHELIAKEELKIGEIDLKEQLKNDLTNIYNELKKYVKK